MSGHTQACILGPYKNNNIIGDEKMQKTNGKTDVKTNGNSNIEIDDKALKSMPYDIDNLIVDEFYNNSDLDNETVVFVDRTHNGYYYLKGKPASDFFMRVAKAKNNGIDLKLYRFRIDFVELQNIMTGKKYRNIKGIVLMDKKENVVNYDY